MIKQIQSVSVFPSTATQLRVDDVLVVLGESANLQWALLDSEGKVLVVDRVSMTGEDYQTWNSDDNTPFDFVANKLNLTVVPESEE